MCDNQEIYNFTKSCKQVLKLLVYERPEANANFFVNRTLRPSVLKQVTCPCAVSSNLPSDRKICLIVIHNNSRTASSQLSQLFSRPGCGLVVLGWPSEPG